MISGLGDLYPFLCTAPPLSKGATFGQRGDEVTASGGRAGTRQTEVLMQQRAMRIHHDLLVEIYRTTIVSQAAVETPQPGLRRDPKANVVQISGNRQSALAPHKSMVRLAYHYEMGEQIDSDPSQPVRIVQDLGKSLGAL
jgi:hypothetical protein